ncbi:two-component sensor histidine kinase [Nonomuraea phyllanthi]|uniref:histidine kinase n=1 Tax=Nonomuraea phyllanthi TaxID=2219224 RepID=A0A5C4WVI6_9ACTN|nr:histidine kinase [Nonomuraea phyllanthi]KAB8196682.1 two-component sensor histidine kinase [Nonomuraea phyllanthi]
MEGARPRPVDAVAVLVAAALTTATGYPAPVLLVLVAAAVPLLWTRGHPLAVAWVSAGTAIVLPLSAVLWAVPPPAAGTPIWPPACVFAAYGAMAYAADRGVRRWLPVIVLSLAVLALPGRSELVLRTEAAIALATLYGMYVAVNDRLRRELAERAERVERERLAGEMHDVVTHRVSRMVLRAGSLAMSAGDERGRAVAEEIRAIGCEALDELRHMVALLRRGTGEGFDLGLPLPDLRPLVTESARAGQSVELVVDGTPVPVSGVVGRTAYVLVQEALADVGKYAPGAEVRVRVAYLPGEVRIHVRNTPGRPDAWITAGDWGLGLADLRERVKLAGGTLESGGDGAGGFRIEATFPTSPQ